MGRHAGGKKTGGKKKGSKHIITMQLRERIDNFLNDNWQQVQEDFDKLQPKERLLLYERLLNYILPKMQAMAIANKTGMDINLPEWFNDDTNK